MTPTRCGDRGSPRNLFGQPFEWVEGDADRQDLVARHAGRQPEGPFWGPLTAADYIELAARGEDAEQGVARPRGAATAGTIAR